VPPENRADEHAEQCEADGEEAPEEVGEDAVDSGVARRGAPRSPRPAA
jgi:hypothetical protein